MKTQTLFLNFGSILYSLITVLLALIHKNVYINMASINSKKREAGKLNKPCEKTKILDDVKKRKLSSRAIIQEFIKSERLKRPMLWRMMQSLDKNLKSFKVKGLNISKEKISKNSNLLILCSWFKKCEASIIYVNGPLLEEEDMNIKQSLNIPKIGCFQNVGRLV